ncbi:MAG: formate--tetrahydrofolate ligase [Candidatus Nanoperiomorbaceae bacterium]
MDKNKMETLVNIAQRFGLSASDLDFYGDDKAKIRPESYGRFMDNPDGKLILVTAISPTPAGEGKTTVSVGLADAMNQITSNSAVLSLREPSMGPVFGMKGGAVGGGRSQLTPADDINLHFTGDLAAIAEANNLLAALIDNHIYWGNTLNIDPSRILFKRCLDVNDRALRSLRENASGNFARPHDDDFTSGFNITAASEIMAILCLASDLVDLKTRLGRILIGFSRSSQPIFAHDLHAEEAMTILLKDAINPNIVQSRKGTLALVHGGPFANIAHGTSSIRAAKLALKLGDYVVTEAGFGADLGAEKFVDIFARGSEINPAVAVLVASVRALKYNGGADLKNITDENPVALEIGLDNLKIHLRNLKSMNLPTVVAINKFADDHDNELNFVRDFIKKLGVECEIVDVFSEVGDAENLAKTVLKLTVQTRSQPHFVYDLADDITTKIRKIATTIYGASDIELSDQARQQLGDIDQDSDLQFAQKLPICIAKTQYSLSDDSKKLAVNLRQNPDFTIKIRELEIDAGAGFIVAIAGQIYRMPGLPRVPASANMTIDADGSISGLK